MEIELRNIHKAFGSNEVLKGVDLKLKSGEVHALMGEKRCRQINTDEYPDGYSQAG
mgnify:CR=1 FL=1